LRRRSNPNYEGVNINGIKFGQSINTIVPFAQSMSKEDHLKKRSELSKGGRERDREKERDRERFITKIPSQLKASLKN
jgi:hypothetical protein